MTVMRKQRTPTPQSTICASNERERERRRVSHVDQHLHAIMTPWHVGGSSQPGQLVRRFPLDCKSNQPLLVCRIHQRRRLIRLRSALKKNICKTPLKRWISVLGRKLPICYANVSVAVEREKRATSYANSARPMRKDSHCFSSYIRLRSDLTCLVRALATSAIKQETLSVDYHMNTRIFVCVNSWSLRMEVHRFAEKMSSSFLSERLPLDVPKKQWLVSQEIEFLRQCHG